MRWMCGLTLAVGLVLSAGCDSAPVLADLEGTVTYDGQVVDAGAISLVSMSDKGRSGGGSIVDGKIILNPENRVPPGKYQVKLVWSKKTGKKFKTEAGELLDDRDSTVLPKKYNDNSELTIELKAGKNVENFDLKK